LRRIFNARKSQQYQRGFTLVELIIVIAILALLSGLAMTKYSSILTKSKIEVHNNNLEMIIHAAQLYYDSNGQAAIADIATLINAGYLKDNPTNPLDSQDAYNFSANATGAYTISPGRASLNSGGISKNPNETGTL